MKNTSTRGLMLATTIIAGLSFVAPAFAQTSTTAAPEKEAEVVVVTGTRIQTPGTTSSSPITTIAADELSLQQASEVEKVLRNLPITVPGDGANTNNGTAGATTVNLRDLGAQRNLIMIDGKRVTPYNFNGIVDVSIVPAAMLEGVDIVTGGASAVYGSDAISGAINFRLKRNFQGVEADVERSQTGAGDGDITNISLAMGAALNDDRGNVALALNYTKREGVQFGDRDYGRVGVSTASGAGLGNTGAAQPANCSGDNTVPTTFGGSGTTVPSRLNFVPGAATGLQFRDDGTLGAFCNQFNFNPYNYYQTPQERYSGIAYGNYSITDDIEAYGRLSFAAINVRQQIAPSGIFNNLITTPLSNPFLSASARQTLIDRFNAGRLPGAAGTATALNNNWFDNNNNGVVDAADSVRFAVGRRTIEFGERSSTYDNNAFQTLVGLRGTLFEDDSWSWDVSLQHGESDRTNVSAGYTNVTNALIAANTVSTTSCTTATGVTTSGCVPLNLFGAAGSITPAMAAYSSAVGIEKQNYVQTIVSGSISGPVDGFKLPWAESPLQLALGAEYREESGGTTPDECLKLAPASCLGGAGGNTLPIEGGFEAEELFAEAILPIATDRPFFQSLDLELGIRSSNFEPTGPTTSWKAGFNWAFNDSVRLRVMQQRAVRAPNVGELAAPLTSGLDNATRDPCSVANTSISTALRTLCISTGMTTAQVGAVPDIIAGQINIFSGTNLAALPDPEQADTTTVGIVFTPSFLTFLKSPVISLDYYNITIEGFIGELGSQEILDLCYVQGISSFCNQIIRVGGSLVLPGSGIQAFTQNLVSADAAGVDLNVGFGLDLDTLGLNEKWGSLRFSYNANFTTKNESLSSLAGSTVDCLGLYGTQCGNPSPEYRHVQRTTWTVGDLRMSYLWRHIGEASVEPTQLSATFDPFEKIKAHNYIDLLASYALNDKVELSFSVNNVFDKEPPIVGGEIATTASNGGNTFPQTYDPLGRVYTVGFNLKF
jgi:iron complex outermembrane recepter protein